MGDFLTSLWGELALFLASWSVLTGGIWTLADRVEKVASRTLRHSASGWLRRAEPGKLLQSLADILARAFDAAFGRSHLSWKCFVRSSLASYAYVTFLFILWIALRPEEFANFLQARQIAIFSGLLLVVTLFVNVFPDYLSLLKTRLAIKLIDTSSKPRIFLVILGDSLLSAAIGFIGLAVLEILNVAPDVRRLDWRESTEMLWAGMPQILSLHAPYVDLTVRSRDYVIPPGMFFYSTFMTSLWVWLVALSALLVRVATITGRGWQFVLRGINFEKQPFLSLGVVSILIVTFLYIAALPFVILL